MNAACDEHRGFNQGYTSALRDLAKLIKRAYEVREASYVPAEWDRSAHRDMSSTLVSGGYYKLGHEEAVKRAASELGIADDMLVPVVLALHWSNDAIEWANKLLDEQKA